MLTTLSAPMTWHKILTRSFFVGTLAAVGILSGVAPELRDNVPYLTLNSSAYAQNFTQADVNNVAQAILDMESLRQQAYEDIKQIIGSGGNIPNITCNQRSSFRSLPSDAREIAVNYCNSSRAIIESSGLSITQFNQITTAAQSNPELKKQIQDAMIQLRRRN